jgi:hypothetical protein
VERGVVIGGLMICGSFLLAAMLNRSAMEEVPAPAAPAAVIAPMSPPVPEAAVAPSPADCAEVEADATAAVTEKEQPPPDRCRDPD